MNKNEFINEIYSQSGLTKKDCKLCLETMINVIKSALQNGESVTLSNFGKFKVKIIPASLFTIVFIVSSLPFRIIPNFKNIFNRFFKNSWQNILYPVNW